MLEVLLSRMRSSYRKQEVDEEVCVVAGVCVWGWGVLDPTCQPKGATQGAGLSDLHR